MSTYHLKQLQNGSDIRGIALTGIPGQLPNLTPDEGLRLTQGFLLWLSNKTGKRPKALKVAVGRDPRLSGQLLKHSVFNGFGPYGVDVLDCAIASTPAMFMSTIFPEYDCDGAIMITASHLPYNRNGFKYFYKGGGLNKEDISQIISFAESDEELAALGAPTAVDSWQWLFGKKLYPSTLVDLMDTYSSHLRRLIKEGINHPSNYDRPLTGLKIFVDAGNGGGGFFATKVLEPLGADTSASLYLYPDGTFPNHLPNPESKEVMAEASIATLSSGSDLGLIFDTDVDRSAAVDSRGHGISRDSIVALAASLISDQHKKTTVVTDSITSDELTTFLEKDLGLKHFRFKRGYRNVINKAIELNAQGIDSQLAIETSGHGAFKENYFLDDGAYLATKIVIKAALLKQEGKTLDVLLEKLQAPKESMEIRIPILTKDFAPYGDNVLDQLSTFVENHPSLTLVKPNYEGLRISCEHGWCLLRKSLHDPIMPLNIAAHNIGGCKKILDYLKDFLDGFNQLDLTLIEKI
ncbi:MAG: phosphomannomutase/phosphoglucomutase [Anaerovoracaceae bacterium]